MLFDYSSILHVSSIFTFRKANTCNVFTVTKQCLMLVAAKNKSEKIKIGKLC